MMPFCSILVTCISSSFVWKMELDNGLVELCKNWELTAPWTGVKDCMHEGGFKREVPFIQDAVVMEGVLYVF